MIINWLLASVLSSLLLLGAGYAAEHVVRALRLPSRWIWVTVLTCSMAFSFSMLATRIASRTVPGAQVTNPRARSETTLGSARSGGRTETVPANVMVFGDEPWIARVRRAGAWRAAIGVNEDATRGVDTALLIACAALALTGLGVIAIIYGRLRRVAATLERATVMGTNVLLSRNIGPAVIGVLRYRIILPQWVTELPPKDVRAILAHEQQHVATADPALILVGLLMIALQPWNVALWMAWSRLRLAVEADCDARVLATGFEMRTYGEVLLAVYQRAEREHLPLAALVSHGSQLETRIRLLVSGSRQRWTVRTSTALGGALLFGIAAVSLDVTAQRPAARITQQAAVSTSPARPTANPSNESRLPTNTLPTAASPSDLDSLRFYLDDVRVSRARASQVPLDDIATIDSRYPSDGVEIHIRTLAVDTPKTKADSSHMRADSVKLHASQYVMRFYARRHLATSPNRNEAAFVWRVDTGAFNDQRLRAVPKAAPAVPTAAEAAALRKYLASNPSGGLVFIDGVRTDPSLLRLIDPSKMAGIESIPGFRAATLYVDPDARLGVVRLTTKRP